MGSLEQNTTLIYGIHLRESANDGSDFSNGAADYRVLFLGEDGQLHVKDSAGTVTDIGSGSGIAATIFDAKGDILGASAADTAARIPAGNANNDVLATNSALTAGAGFLRHRFCRKTGDESFSTTSYNDSTNMSFSIEASKVYTVRFVIFFQTNASTVGIKLAIQGPASCAATFGDFMSAAAPAGGGSAVHHGAATSTDISTDLEFASATAGPGATPDIAILEGLIVNSTNAGTLKLRHGSETATSTTILNRSYGEMWEVA